MKYVYPAIFYTAIEGGFSVEFPDVQGAVTQGDTLFEALEMAEDALSIILCGFEERAKKVPEPTPIEKVTAEPDEFSTSAFVTLIKADTDAYRRSL